jgi:uncharacterized membrane protein YdjX (TVP38/TMEM64 family)
MFEAAQGPRSRRSALEWAAMGLAGALLGAIWLGSRWLGLEWSVESLRSTVSALGPWAPAGFVVLLVFRSLLLLPGPLLLTVSGLLFGAPAGALWSALGLTLSALLQYAVVRWIGADALLGQLGPVHTAAIRVARTRAGGVILGLASAYPAGPPIAVAQLAAALAGMRPALFASAVLLGSGVRAASFAWLGSALLEGRGLAAAAALLLALAGLPLLLPRTRAWLRDIWRGG